MTRIKVASPSFSTHPILREKLQDAFPDSVFNIQGRRLTGHHEIVDYLQDADGAIIGLEKVDKPVLDALKRVQIYSKYGVGLDNIDVTYARSIGKHIGWQPGINRRSVSEMTLCFMIGLCRNIFQTSHLLKQGMWKKNGGVQLTSRTVGIIGCGFIGEDVLSILKPFGCRVLINDILDKSDVALQHAAHQVDLPTILKESDLVSLHVPLTELTQGMVDDKFLAKMKPGSFLINTCRGPVVEQTALKQALISGPIAGAALDVFEVEPPSDLEFLSLPNLMVTPHIGGNAREAIEAMGLSAIENLIQYFGRK